MPLSEQANRPYVTSSGKYDLEYISNYSDVKMLNVGGVEGMDQEMASKSAFMELQQQGMHPGMGHPAYPMRSSYQGHHQHAESVFSNPQNSRPLPYPFHMNAMSPSSYNSPAGHPFSMPPYQSPSPTRDGKYRGLGRKFQKQK